MITTLAWPLASLLALPVGWLEYIPLPRTRWARLCPLPVAVVCLYAERCILTPRFGQEYQEYRRRTPFLLPTWGWILWGLLFTSVGLSMITIR
jgi:protein-S-isoprenylcysteine O-methyltransferase Ste14